ncbi:MAG: hypothetical protein HY513_01230 [Candidatus Aenigmarchaeota archaeon]|nr:hypothetical protein [Candidatus Aenigmarchaeota archaeon]
MVRITAVQMRIDDTKGSSLDTNAREICSYMESANGSDIICFPETSLSGLPRPTYADKTEGQRSKNRK